MSVFDFDAVTIKGKPVSLEQYRGKALLIVNTASKCGFTPQYKGLESLYQQYKDQGLEILGFPCDQFGHQEPGSDSEITEFCELNFGVTFPLFSKIDVNGKNAHPLFTFLKEQAPGVMGTTGIKWNFTKFLVDPEGNVVQRFAPKDAPEKLAQPVAELLK
ncbi:glutathione peroxidase [Parendozoicomonas haliclonae]|uniref:Glutathione peroxidase n=1 Tax=Parendozoicomonas haliclonae TaxID=1960125 RepID=A0A1X7ALR4_9GAMM|nr:glutathione peroxidase [Parendozoicomonas haliclonae]SMA48441.1 Hydroperoxy fatty acid reductase gpx1 [Parendozoicomonas haliclonae]